MYTVVYMSEAGKIEETKFETNEECQAFFKELAKKNIPVRRPEAEPSKNKTRLEELDGLISTNRNSILKLSCSSPQLVKLIEERVKYEIEKHDLRMRIG